MRAKHHYQCSINEKDYRIHHEQMHANKVVKTLQKDTNF